MRRTTLLIFAALCAPVPCDAAERKPLPPRPYDTVAIEPQAAFGDTTFATFRKEFAAVARSRIYADLARLVTPQGYFWDRDFAQAYDGRRPAVDNLAAAIRLEHFDGLGWQRLERFAAETALEPQEARPGTVCAPARPSYDVVAYAQLLDRTFTAPADWTYPRTARLKVSEAPNIEAETVAELGAHFVRLLTPADGAGKADLHDTWTAVVTPAGKPAYAAPGSLGSLNAPQLCYGKDAFGRWHIVGFVAGG